jgi:hypothetical protein
MTWREYHELTKHSAESLRRNRHYLDWANMPNPFRHYEDVPILDLPSDPPLLPMELGAARLRIGPGQHWEDHFIARLKLGSCRHPEAIDLGLCRGQSLAAE